MKRIFKNKKKMLAICAFLLVSLTACTTPRNQSGQTYVDSIITLDETEVKRSQIGIPESSKLYSEEELNKLEAMSGDEVITIPPTKFTDTLDEGWFYGLIVWPLAQLLNLIGGFSDAGVAIIVVTFLIQLLTFVFSIKSQVSAQKIQMLQPEMNRITAKYAGKTDDRSKMMQAQEMQALYAKHKINPFGSILITFIQFPIILGMYQATMRASTVVIGSFAGINLSINPMEGGITNGNWAYLAIYGLMIVFQLVSFKLPQWLQERRKKKSGVKIKKYAEPKKSQTGMAGSMNMMMYMSTGMIAIFAIQWPLAMSFYWLVGSIARVIQNVVIHKFFIKD